MRLCLHHIRFGFLSLAAVCCLSLPAQAIDTTWTGAASSDFFTDGNWDNSAPNTASEIAFINGGDNQPAAIDAATETVTLGGFNLGTSGADGGNVIQNGGTLIVAADASDQESNISGASGASSSWIMNGDSVILYDDPLGGGGNGLGTDGGAGKDFDVGDSDSGNPGILELHDNAVLRISDDLKIADNGSSAAATILLDGNAQATIGSGTSIGDGGPAELTVAGSALYLSGNSGGPGNSAQGRTNEGYLTMHDADIVVKESGRLFIRTLQHRGGTSSVTIQDNGQFHIFDAFAFSDPELGVATVAGPANGDNAHQRTSEVAENTGDEMTITLKNSGIMTVDVDIDDSPWSGLALSGGQNRGGNGDGGTTLVDVYDSANFTVQQNLNMTMGTSESASSTLKVHGPDATIIVNGDLRLGLDPAGEANDENATAAIHAVITDSNHSTVEVGGDALIANGELVVELDGYTPVGNETYVLLSSGNPLTEEFAVFDASAAPLPEPLEWGLEYSDNDVLLKVLGAPIIFGDVNGDGEVNGLDVDPFVDVLLIGPYQVEADMNEDGEVNGLDVDPFVDAVVGGGTAAVPEPSTLALLMASVVGALFFRRRVRR